ncbi:hypothetical protein RJ641_031667 [Dillenia turbinata]|uniref:Uncharacterized protein n=1 Tax=Dillenia turbinata TaxID=194707 RepID=A0AAN8ZES9_9MAGN
MWRFEHYLVHSLSAQQSHNPHSLDTDPNLLIDALDQSSLVRLISSITVSSSSSCCCSSSSSRKLVLCGELKREKSNLGGISLATLSIKRNGDERCGNDAVVEEETKKKEKNKKGKKVSPRGSGAMNTSKHLWAGAVSAMVSRSILFFVFAINAWHSVLENLVSHF